MGQHFICKVSDFGLAGIINYETHREEKFPIKWTAPEAAIQTSFLLSQTCGHWVSSSMRSSRGQVSHAYADVTKAEDSVWILHELPSQLLNASS